MLLAEFQQYFFGFSIFISSLFLVMLVLVQRGRGGGLTGALGGAGGQSAFGTKAGDLFTRITVGVAALWIFLCAAAVFFMRDRALPQTGVEDRNIPAATGTVTPGTVTPGTVTPGTVTPGIPAAGLVPPTGPTAGTSSGVPGAVGGSDPQPAPLDLPGQPAAPETPTLDATTTPPAATTDGTTPAVETTPGIPEPAPASDSPAAADAATPKADQ